MRGLAIVCLAVVVGAGRGTPASQPESTAAGVELDLPDGWKTASRTILPGNLLRDVSRLASDEFEGRLPGSNGDRLARRHLIDRLTEMGYEPFFDGGRWEQPVKIVGLSSAMPEQWSFHGPEGTSVSYAFADEYMGASGVQQPQVSDHRRRGRLRRLRHPGAGGRLGRLQGRRPARQGPADAQRRPGLGPRDVRRRAQALLRPLDLQVRERRAPGGRRQRSSSTPRPRPATPGRWCARRGSASSSSCPPATSRASGSTGWLTEDASRRLVALSGHDLDDARRGRALAGLPAGAAERHHLDRVHQ